MVIRQIQSLRAVAAIAVVAFHASQMLHVFEGPAMTQIGAFGVDLFFVISGVIMSLIAARAGARPGAFLLRRIIRIVPLYWGFTLLIFAAATIRPEAFRAVHADLSHLALSLAFIPHLDPVDPTSMAPMFPLGWTLTYEMAFYLLVAASLAAPKAWRFGFVPGGCFAIVAAGWFFDPATPILAYLSDPVLLEFAAGYVLGRLYRRGALDPCGRRTGSGIVALGLALFALMLGADEIPRLLSVGVPAFYVVLGALCLERADAARGSRTWQMLGDASYSIYLSHVFTLGLARLALAQLDLAAAHPLVAAGVLVLAIELSLIVGVLVYRAIERPMLAELRSRFEASQARTPLPVGATS